MGMWPARARRAPAGATRRHGGVGVVNAGISGNRVLGDNTSGLARLARDALAVPGVRWMTLLEGINDITAATRGGPGGHDVHRGDADRRLPADGRDARTSTA